MCVSAIKIMQLKDQMKDTDYIQRKMGMSLKGHGGVELEQDSFLHMRRHFETNVETGQSQT